MLHFTSTTYIITYTQNPYIQYMSLVFVYPILIMSTTKLMWQVDKIHGILALRTTHVNSAASLCSMRSGRKKVKNPNSSMFIYKIHKGMFGSSLQSYQGLPMLTIVSSYTCISKKEKSCLLNILRLALTFRFFSISSTTFDFQL